MNKYKRLIKQLVLFGLVGGVSLLIDLAVTTSTYNFLHFPPYLAGGVGFLSAFFFNFPVNRKHVFNHTKNDRFILKTQIALYVTLSLFNLFMTGLLMQLIVGHGILKIGLAKICVTGAIAIWNFVLFKFFIFSKRPQTIEIDRLIIQ